MYDLLLKDAQSKLAHRVRPADPARYGTTTEIITGQSSAVIVHYAADQGARGVDRLRVAGRRLRPDASDLVGIGPIMAGVDFSPKSRAALAAACDLAAAFATDVEAVHIVPRLPVLERWQPHADAAVHQRVQGG